MPVRPILSALSLPIISTLNPLESRQVMEPECLSSSIIGPVEGLIHHESTYGYQSGHFARTGCPRWIVRLYKRPLFTVARLVCKRPAVRERLDRIAIGLPYCGTVRRARFSGADHRVAGN